MKRLAVLLMLCGAISVPSVLGQEEHFQVGAYADYFRLSQAKTNFAGVGARLGLGLSPHVMVEGEMNYDFNQAFSEGFSSGTTVTVQRSNIRLLHGLFGPKVSLGHANLHPFVTIKGGFLDTMFDSRPANLQTFFSSVDNLRSQNVQGVFYPGGGLEGHLGPVGMRLDVGDEIYFNSGTHNNLRVAIGPYIRF